jgi:hypothetical protein
MMSRKSSRPGPENRTATTTIHRESGRPGVTAAVTGWA